MATVVKHFSVVPVLVYAWQACIEDGALALVVAWFDGSPWL